MDRLGPSVHCRNHFVQHNGCCQCPSSCISPPSGKSSRGPDVALMPGAALTGVIGGGSSCLIAAVSTFVAGRPFVEGSVFSFAKSVAVLVSGRYMKLVR